MESGHVADFTFAGLRPLSALPAQSIRFGVSVGPCEDKEYLWHP